MINPWLFVILDIAVLLLVFWVVNKFYYRITRTHVEVRLFGICLRKIDLTDIKRITKNPEGMCEQWANTVFNYHKRKLILVRRSGMLKNFLITPRHRYTFKAELKRMIARRWEELLGAQPQETAAVEVTMDEED